MSRPARLARHGLIAFVALSVAVPAGVAARSPAPDPEPSGLMADSITPERAADVAPRGLIVTWRDGTPSASRAAARAAAGVELLHVAGGSGVEAVRPRGRSVEAATAALRARPEVALVAPDAHRTRFVNPATETYWNLQWGHHNTGQPVHGYAGVADVDVDALEALTLLPNPSSVVVAVIDDGVDFSHPDLAGQAWVNAGESGLDAGGANKATNGVDDDGNGYIDDVNGWDFCNDDNTVHDAFEDFHGTGVASVIGSRVNGGGMTGIAPGVRIMALKFLQNEADEFNPRCGWDSMAIEAIAYAKHFGVRIVNASWGGGGGDPALEAAIEGSGALFVAAAGNDDMNIDIIPSYPAAFDSPNIITVAAIHNEGSLSGFSNHGRTHVDLSAPGEDVIVASPPTGNHPQGPYWAWAHGTSFAAPYVAGIAALGAAARPSLLQQPTVLRSRLLATGTALPSTAGLTATGRLANARRMIDFTPPTLAGGVSVLPTVARLGSSSMKVRLSWGAAADDLAMGSYRIEQRRNGGVWTAVANVVTARTFDLVVSLSGTYQFRVFPRDALGNLGVPALSRVVAPARYDDTAPEAAYAGAWQIATLATATGGRTHFTTVSNASVTFTFTGRTGAVVAPTTPTRSSFRVYVDGVYVRTVSLYSSVTKAPTMVFTTGTMASGTHRIKLVNAPVGSRTRADVDAFVVLR